MKQDPIVELYKLNLGCGKDYKEGWINLDFNKNIKADIYANLTKKLPFKSNKFDIILMDNVLEHIKRENLFKFLEDINRISKDKAILKIYVPHYSSMYALRHLTHYNFFGIGTFDIFLERNLFNGERYSNLRYKIKKQELLFFHHKLANIKFLSKIPINWLFNCNLIWQRIMERFQFLGFDEIYYELEVIK